MRVIIFNIKFLLLPLSIISWANLNFNLCRPNADPFIVYIGNWYYLLAEYYLNIISILTYLFTYALGKGIYLMIVKPL